VMFVHVRQLLGEVRHCQQNIPSKSHLQDIIRIFCGLFYDVIRIQTLQSRMCRMVSEW
jgi:hypothetical protein